MTQEKSSSLLRQRVFGGLWAGSVASSIGSSAGLLAITWFVYTSTGSAFDIALVGIAGLAPRILFGVASGALADRYGRLRVMLSADVLRAITMILFAASIVLLKFQLPIVLTVAFLLGIGQSLFRPAINAFLPTSVPRERLASANGLFSVAQEITGIIGGPLGGFLIGVVGVAATIAFNGASYLASGLFIVVVSMSITSKPSATSRNESPQFLKQVREGFEYINRERGLMKLTIASFGANFFLSMFFTFLVIYVTDVLRQGSFVFGVLAAASGAGFGVGSLLVSKTKAEVKFGIWFAVFWGAAGIGIFGLVLFPSTIASVLSVFIISACGGFGNTTFLTGVQKFVPNELLERYLSLDEVGSLAASPAGQIAGGVIISTTGLGINYTIAAIGTAIFAFGLLLFPDVRALQIHSDSSKEQKQSESDKYETGEDAP